MRLRGIGCRQGGRDKLSIVLRQERVSYSVCGMRDSGISLFQVDGKYVHPEVLESYL